MTGIKRFALTLSTAALMAGSAMAQDAVKIAYIEGMSGPFANTGDAGLKHFRFAAERINENGGMNGSMVEVDPFDSQTNPREALVQLQRAIDQGYRYVAQGNGSSVASALIDGIDKHNARNPGDEVLFLNYAAVDPAFTNDACSFWHFRFDADADMKMTAMTDWIADQPDIKNVYIIGQDYSFGQAVSAAANRMLEEKRPDIEIVGDELHPLGKVKDFSPYVQKILSSGADAVITGNWGQDLALLVKAAADSGSEFPFLTYYGGGLGAPSSIGEAGIGKVYQVTEFHENMDEASALPLDVFEEEFDGLDYYYHRVFVAMDMLKMAVEEADSTDPVDVAFALEGMEYSSPLGDVYIREDNHQVIQPLYISEFTDEVERGVEGLDIGFRTIEDGVIPADATVAETTCEMERPEQG